MSVPDEAKKVMQSVLDQWQAVERLEEATKRVLSPAEGARLTEARRESAERALNALDADTARATPDRALRTDVPEPDFEEEPTAVRELRLILTRHTGE